MFVLSHQLHHVYGICRNLSPAECDKKILELASRFTLYGLDFHDALVINRWHHRIILSLCPSGSRRYSNFVGCKWLWYISVLWRNAQLDQAQSFPMVRMRRSLLCNVFLCIIRVRVSSVNYKNKQLILEMLPIVVCMYVQ